MECNVADLKGKRILVTGGAGFIGSELVRQCCVAGAEVIAVDNLVNGKRENLDGVEGSLRLESIDIRDTDRMTGLMRGLDSILHLACLGVRHSIHAPAENHDVNATATLNLLALARASDVSRFVYVSSSEVYGTARHVPMTEMHPTFPMTVYGGSKLAGECYARAYWETYRYPTVVVRPFNSFGPRCHHEGDSGEVIPKFMLRAMAGLPLRIFGDGTQTRDFTHVSDTARGILLSAISEASIGKTINIGSGAEHTINDLAKMISDLAAGGKARVEYDEPRPGDVLRLYADCAKARDLIGFKPSVGLKEGLASLYNWYCALNCPPEVLLEEEMERNWLKKSATPRQKEVTAS
jgi:UDP-glucose 4-epimerase